MKSALIVGLCLLALTAGRVTIAAAQTDSSSDSDARVYFDQGRAAYEAGKFDEAARAFRRAYVLSPRFALLYNIGQAELRAGRDQLAIEAFEAYLRHAPMDDPRRGEVEERARVLHSMGVRGESTEAPTLAPPPSDQEPASPTPVIAPESAPATNADESTGSSKLAPWLVVGGGAVAMVGGAVLMAVGLSNASDVTDAPDGTRWSDIEGSASSANTLWGVGLGLVGIGAVATGLGLFWALSDGDDTDSSAHVRIGAGNVMFQGAF